MRNSKLKIINETPWQISLKFCTKRDTICGFLRITKTLFKFHILFFIFSHISLSFFLLSLVARALLKLRRIAYAYFSTTSVTKQATKQPLIHNRHRHRLRASISPNISPSLQSLVNQSAPCCLLVTVKPEQNLIILVVIWYFLTPWKGREREGEV